MSSKEHGAGLGAMTLGALGVVYGDIGTSPLYTMSTIFGPEGGVPLDARHLAGARDLAAVARSAQQLAKRVKERISYHFRLDAF